jgi:seryl-tRNA synthetase
MLDIRLIREQPDMVRAGLAKKRVSAPLEEVIELDATRRRLIAQVEQLKAERNRASEEVARLRKAGQSADDVIAQTRETARRIAELEAGLQPVEARLEGLLLEIPNLPDPSVPDGAGEEDNVVVDVVGESRQPAHAVIPHWDLGPQLDVIDFERARKLSGTRFAALKGFGAALSRALINLMVEEAVRRGYLEVSPPYLVLEDAMVGTGQLPKFVDDVFRVEPHGLYLIPTAEVPLTNLHREEILDPGMFPLKYCAYTASFRSEAGAAGRDTRGLIRLHQFDKVELVKLVHPDRGLEELESMVEDARHILDLLGLPYRVVLHCTGDLGFGHVKAYDLEVWMPSYGRYVEISSVSWMGDFQARRANIRFRPSPGAPTRFVGTLNGSALAVGRTIAAILENYQTPDRRVTVPFALQPYLHGVTIYPETVGE